MATARLRPKVKGKMRSVRPRARAMHALPMAVTRSYERQRNVLHAFSFVDDITTDRINQGSNAIASVRLSVRLFVSTLPMEPTDR